MDSNHSNDRYATAEYVWKADPSIFLAAEAATLSPGRAVDLACGEGRTFSTAATTATVTPAAIQP